MISVTWCKTPLPGQNRGCDAAHSAFSYTGVAEPEGLEWGFIDVGDEIAGRQSGQSRESTRLQIRAGR
jgi:hypothetical protein